MKPETKRTTATETAIRGIIPGDVVRLRSTPETESRLFMTVISVNSGLTPDGNTIALDSQFPKEWLKCMWHADQAAIHWTYLPPHALVLVQTKK